jgi:SAM-dependent methyltransferase
MDIERLILNDYTHSEPVYQHLSRYEFSGKYVVGKRVLDVACGSGYGARILKEAGAAYVLGVDVDAGAVEYATSHYSVKDVEFAVVISFETIEHLRDPKTFLRQVAKVLEPHGVFLVSTPVRQCGTLDDKPKNPYHVREWISGEFEFLLRMYFGNVEMIGQYDFKRWFPYSRKLQRLLSSWLLPKKFKGIERYPVLFTPPELTGFRFNMIYMVALCNNAPPGVNIPLKHPTVVS